MEYDLKCLNEIECLILIPCWTSVPNSNPTDLLELTYVKLSISEVRSIIEYKYQLLLCFWLD
jgi:hypothetical protein